MAAQNDDVTGRMLDSIYEAGASDIYPVIAKNALQELGLSCHRSHMARFEFLLLTLGIRAAKRPLDPLVSQLWIL